MAANSSKCRGITVVFGKRVVDQIWTATTLSPLTIRRAAFNSSVYEKNPDDQIGSSVVPEDVIQATHSDKYWAPHPQTGVFGPPTTAAGGAGDRGFRSASTANAATSSVLEEKAWFRPTSLEDLEKPHFLP